MVLWVGLQCVVVKIPDHTHFLRVQTALHISIYVRIQLKMSKGVTAFVYHIGQCVTFAWSQG